MSAERKSPPLQTTGEVDSLQQTTMKTTRATTKPGNANQRASSWAFESAAEIAVRHVPPARFDIDDLLPEEDGPAIMFGPPGSLKSWLALHAAECMATGVPFLGHFPVRRRASAVYVNIDAGRNAFARRVIRSGCTAPNLFVVSPDSYDAEEMRKVFASHPGAFVVIDTFSDAYRTARGDDQAETMRRFLREQRAMYHDHKCNGLILDHPHRPRDGQAHGDYYGSTQKEATARCMWQVSLLPSAESGVARAKITCRKMSESEPFAPVVAAINFSGETVVATFGGRLDSLGGKTAGPSDVETVEQVLRSVGEGMSRSALEERTGLSRDRVLATVSQSRNIVTTGRGRALLYVLYESPGAADDSKDDSETSSENRPESYDTLRSKDDTGDSPRLFPTHESPGEQYDCADDSRLSNERHQDR